VDHGHRGSKRLRCSDTRGGERGGSAACLSGCARRPDRQRCGRGTGAQKQKSERKRARSRIGLLEDEHPRLDCAVQRGRARAQPAAEPEAQGKFASGETWQRHDHHGCCDPGSGYDREHDTRGDPGSWEGNRRGRSRFVNSRAHPSALSAWARRSSSPADTSKAGWPCESGHEVVAK
jgi:hypothetical protein